MKSSEYFKAKVVNATQAKTLEVGYDYGDGDGFVIPFAGELATVPAVSFTYGDHICNDFSVTVKEPMGGPLSFTYGDLAEIHISNDGTSYIKWFVGQVEEISKEVSDPSGVYEDTITYTGRGLWKNIEKLLFYLGNDTTNSAGWNTDPTCLYGLTTLQIINYMFNGVSLPGLHLPIGFTNPVISAERPTILYDQTNVEQSVWTCDSFKTEWESATSILDTLKNVNTGYSAGMYLTDPARPFLWGVDENRNFRFLQVDSTVGYRWDLGDAPFRIKPTIGDLASFNRTTNTENIVNELLFSGHQVKAHIDSIWSADSKARYGRHQRRINNRSVVKLQDAIHWWNGFAYWTCYPLDNFEISLRVKNSPVRVLPFSHGQLFLDGTAISDLKGLDKFPINSVRYSINSEGIDTNIVLGYPSPDFSAYFREYRDLVNRTSPTWPDRQLDNFRRPQCMFYTFQGCLINSSYFFTTWERYSDGTDMCFLTNPRGKYPNCPKYLPGNLPEVCANAVLDPMERPDDNRWECHRESSATGGGQPRICLYGRGITDVLGGSGDRYLSPAWCYEPAGFKLRKTCIRWFAKVDDDGNYLTASCSLYGVKEECRNGRGWLSNLGLACPGYVESTFGTKGPECGFMDVGPNPTDPKDDICTIPSRSGFLTCTAGWEHGKYGKNDCNGGGGSSYYIAKSKLLAAPSCQYWSTKPFPDETPWCSSKDINNTFDEATGKFSSMIVPPNCINHGQYHVPPGERCSGFKASESPYNELYNFPENTYPSGIDPATKRVTYFPSQTPVNRTSPVNRYVPSAAKTAFFSQMVQSLAAIFGAVNVKDVLQSDNSIIADKNLAVGSPSVGEEQVFTVVQDLDGAITIEVTSGNPWPGAGAKFIVEPDGDICFKGYLRSADQDDPSGQKIGLLTFRKSGGVSKWQYDNADGQGWRDIGSGVGGGLSALKDDDDTLVTPDLMDNAVRISSGTGATVSSDPNTNSIIVRVNNLIRDGGVNDGYLYCKGMVFTSDGLEPDGNETNVIGKIQYKENYPISPGVILSKAIIIHASGTGIDFVIQPGIGYAGSSNLYFDAKKANVVAWEET